MGAPFVACGHWYRTLTGWHGLDPLQSTFLEGGFATHGGHGVLLVLFRLV